MRRILQAIVVACFLLSTCPAVHAQPQSRTISKELNAPLSDLQVLKPIYPQAYFFRASEGFARRRTLDYDRWDQIFSRLMGIEGKVLDEEVPETSIRNIDFFTRFKRQHPDQLVLLHYNGNARDPRYQTEKYFAGHWLYYEGQTLLEDLPAEDGTSEIKVKQPGWFRVNSGRYKTSNDDVCICELNECGKPNWHRAEQMQLVSVDATAKTIRVRRGCYGTEPQAFKGGKAYVAVHAVEGPWGRRSNLMWHYNYTTRCPKDADGRTCADVHAEELATRFAPNGELAAFDGLEFDVLHHSKSRYGRRGGFPGVDCDGDGAADNGVFDGVDEYAIGVIRFLGDLRGRMGDGKLMLADGHSVTSQRGFGILNGIESEGWPTLSDFEMRDWSGGLNRHAFWAASGRNPTFNYINHKYVVAGDSPGATRRPDYPMGINRLVFAAAVFTDAAVCYSSPPRPEPGEAFGIWDELRMGTEHRLGWLGKPLAPPQRLAEQTEDLLDRAFQPPAAESLGRLSGDGVRFEVDGDRLKVKATDNDANTMRFRLRDVRLDGEDLFVSLTASADSISPYPETMARLAYVGIETVDWLMDRDQRMTTGMQRRGEPIGDIDPETGASVGYAGRAHLGGETCTAFRAHPPYKDRKTGMVFWQRDAQVPDGAVLSLHTGMGERAPGRSDGVVFAVEATKVDGGEARSLEEVFSHKQIESRWIEHRIDLDRFAGQTVRLRFVADAGRNDNSTTDHGYWGDVFVAVPDAAGNLPTPRHDRYMTWVGRQPFTSGFYFRQLATDALDLTLQIEGGQPVYIHRCCAPAAPDVIYREFEKGLVIANSSPRPVTIDLGKLSPGKTFRRLQGSSRQDPHTNNGETVGAKLTLPAQDALFLVQTQR